MEKETLQLWIGPLRKLYVSLNKFYTRHNWASAICIVLCVIGTPLAVIYSTEYLRPLWVALLPLVIGISLFVHAVCYGIFEKEIPEELKKGEYEG